MEGDIGSGVRGELPRMGGDVEVLKSYSRKKMKKPGKLRMHPRFWAIEDHPDWPKETSMTTLDDTSNPAGVVPRFVFDRSRWASLREQNVKAVAQRWTAEPHLVEILEDPRLGAAQLVMLRKDMFEQMVVALSGLASGRSAMCFEVAQITKISTVIQSLAAAEAQQDIALLVETVLATAQKLKAQIVPAGPVTRLEAPELSDEEREFLQKQELLDSEDD